MNNQRSLIDSMRAITVSREYGSGGGEIARRLTTKLGWQLIDHEVVVRVANVLGVNESEVEEQDEYAQSTLARILSSMSSVDPSMMMESANLSVTTEDTYQRALVPVVTAAAQKGHVVIVGRGSQKILADQRDVLHIRIIASLEKRVEYVMQREGMSREEAKTRIQEKDRQRERYLQARYHENSSNAHLYDLVINSSVLDLDSIVDLVSVALEHKAARLNVSEQELGPGAGSQRYPGQAHDFWANL